LETLEVVDVRSYFVESTDADRYGAANCQLQLAFIDFHHNQPHYVYDDAGVNRVWAVGAP
jgi:hypothetical protein